MNNTIKSFVNELPEETVKIKTVSPDDLINGNLSVKPIDYDYEYDEEDDIDNDTAIDDNNDYTDGEYEFDKKDTENIEAVNNS